MKIFRFHIRFVDAFKPSIIIRNIAIFLSIYNLYKKWNRKNGEIAVWRSRGRRKNPKNSMWINFQVEFLHWITHFATHTQKRHFCCCLRCDVHIISISVGFFSISFSLFVYFCRNEQREGKKWKCWKHQNQSCIQRKM